MKLVKNMVFLFFLFFKADERSSVFWYIICLISGVGLILKLVGMGTSIY